MRSAFKTLATSLLVALETISCKAETMMICFSLVLAMMLLQLELVTTLFLQGQVTTLSLVKLAAMSLC